MASDPHPAAAVGPLAALSTAFATAAAVLVGGLLWAALPETPLPFGFATQHQDAETLAYLLTFAVLVPASVVAALRLGDRVAATAGPAVLSAATAVLVAALAAVVLVSRTSDPRGGGFEVAVAGAALWWCLAVVLLHRATRHSPSPWLQSLGRGRTAWWIAAGVLVATTAAAFADPRSVSIPALVVAAGVAVLGVAVATRTNRRSLPRWVGRTVDVAVVVGIALAVPAVVIFDFSPAASFDREVIQFHQGFFLGPANQVLAGDALLVDVLSQYGVGSIYVLAAAFTILPMGNGTLALVEGGLSVLMFAGTYAALRLAGVRRLLAAGAMAVAVIAFVFALQTPLGGLLQHGAIRYGLPVGAVLGTVIEARRGSARGAGRALTLVTMAVAAVWALESFAYTLLTAIVGAALLVVAEPASRRRRAAGGWALQLVGAMVAGHVLLAVGTLAVDGSLPQWGWYLETLRAFLVGAIGELTYDFSSYSSGLVVGAVYVASACALAVVVVRRRAVVATDLPAVVATGTLTAHGVALYSYLVNRSADHIIPYVCLPAVAVVALWVHWLHVPALLVPRSDRRVGTAAALGVSVLLIGSTWSTAGYERSALAHAVPGGTSLRTALADLRALPDLQPGASEGAALLAEHLPDESHSIVLTGADLSIEVLMKAERGNRVPLGDPWEDSFVPEGHLDRLADFVDEVAPGDRALLDERSRVLFDAYQADPSLDPFAPDPEPSLVPRGVASLQRWVLYELAQRFDLEDVAASPAGLQVVELVPRP